MASHANSAHDFLDLDIQTLRQFVELFPDEGLSKVVTGYLSSGLSRYPLNVESADAPDLSEGGVSLSQNEALTQEDCLMMMTEGIEDAKDSSLAHCLLGEFYLFLEEYESAVETTRKGLKLAATEAKRTDLSFQRIRDALNSTLATAMVYYQTPRNHPEAKGIFEAILERQPQFTAALIGIGLILEEEEEYANAVEFLEQALKQDPSNGRIGAEAAWCQALSGDYQTGLSRLQDYLEYPQLDASKPRGRELRAQTLYRIGVCMWELDSSKAARRNREGPYAMFLAAIKANPNFAPAYTKLGIFYEDYNRDKKRARQCFQKAFELSPSEIVAAERLARLFANQGEWDIVEVISQRVVDSGKVRTSPGSKKKGVSWPFSALGVVQMNKQEYQKSIVSFLSALRISPDDYHSYIGLGESYHNSGRYNSAAKAFNYAENPSDSVIIKKANSEGWFAKYMLANVNRELSEFKQAIEGYEEVLKERSQEFGVSIALLQTLVEKGWRCIETGFFGEAADSAIRAVDVALTITEYKPDAFNLWKAVGDALSIFTWVQEKLGQYPGSQVSKLLNSQSDIELNFDTHKDIDGIGSSDLAALASEKSSTLTNILRASILAHKRAIASCVHDIHAQAVAWYNLGWTEYRAHICLEQETTEDANLTTYLRAAMRCFKRAIELEAGNSEFWNSLGVITTTLNARVAQHALVRSLHLNERSVRAWTNLGTLYLLQNDTELAHQAFSRAQSTDPDYALAWVGEGIVALLFGDTTEALSHFTHAFELSDSSSLITKRHYAVSTFDFLVSSPSASNNITNLIQPLFALHQLGFQAPYDIPHKHLAALFLERIGNHDAAIQALTTICEVAEQDYETSESLSALARFSKAKNDLARNLLATGSYVPAIEETETALELLSDFDAQANTSILSQSAFDKTMLSARVTAGLAHYFQGDLDAAIPYFRTCLSATNSDPDIICLLAEVLWAKGGENEKDIAREQLFSAVETHGRHVGIVTLLGAMAVTDEDEDTMAAVKEDLDSLRTSSDISESDLSRVEKVIEAISLFLGGEESELDEAKRSVMLAPWKHMGWKELAGATERSTFGAVMARETAGRSVPPLGGLDAKDLADAVAGTGKVGDAQKGVVLAPWRKEGWGALRECVSKA
ncbi:Superkiller protein 3 [Didymosphaeria variabile]|uniref:Superkiller protein 3 n=1 Tax=Didymosphaeria variabile TaxID=1932322 RepID=A0A9W9C7K0_9PLEO|nr:Superkiller protein 3 [Didymosphaeria variabile]KAJ4348373.1 Superkiller protein 3 [Didymosphaeria variabile]